MHFLFQGIYDNPSLSLIYKRWVERRKLKEISRLTVINTSLTTLFQTSDCSMLKTSMPISRREVEIAFFTNKKQSKASVYSFYKG